MAADGNDQRSRPDPCAGGGGGIKIVDGAAARVPAAQRILRGAIGALGDRLVELPVVDAGEGVGLVDDAGDRRGKGRMAHAVEHHRADRDLPDIGLAARLGGDEPREQIDVAAAVLGRTALPGRQSEGRERLRPGLSVRAQAVLPLEPAHRVLGAAAVDAVDLPRVVAPVFEPRLDLGHALPGAAALVQIGVGRLRQRDQQGVDGRDHGDGQRAALHLVAHKTSPTNVFVSLWGIGVFYSSSISAQKELCFTRR